MPHQIAPEEQQRLGQGLSQITDLLTQAHVSGEPTVWFEGLPMQGPRVTWLELALSAGEWKAADVLWKKEREKGPMNKQACARLSVAWLCGVVEFNRSEWTTTISDDAEQGRVMLTWWDRLLPSPSIMLEEVPVKPQWAQRVLGGPSHPESPLAPTTIRPLDMLLEAVALVRQHAWAEDKIVQRLRAVDWSAVPADGWGRHAALAALDKHQMARAARNQWGSAFYSLWQPLVRALPVEQQDLWWKQAFGMVLHDGVPLTATVALFKGRYALEDTCPLVDRVAKRLEDQSKRSGITKQFRIDQATMAGNLVVNVLGPVMDCCEPEAAAVWQAYQDGLMSALEKTDRSSGPGAPTWRALDLAMRMPAVPVVSKPRARF